MSDIDERLEEEIIHASRKSFDSQQAGINANFLMDVQREIERLRADLAAVTAERDYVMAEGLFSADQIRMLKTDLAAVTEERDRMRDALEPFAKLKPVSWSLENDHYFIDTNDIRRASAAANTGDR